MGSIFIFALLAALNPTLVAASTVMMLLPNPKRLMVGYLLGALITSITLGLIIVFSLQGSGVVHTTRRTLSPGATTALGALALVAAFALGTRRHQEAAERRRERKRGKPPPRWQRELAKGTARTTFVVGALLTLPGASYLAGLSRIDKLGYATGATVLLIVAFNLIMLALLELPLLGFTFAPDWTMKTIERSKAWIARHSHRLAVRALTLVGVAFVLRGVIGFVT